MLAFSRLGCRLLVSSRIRLIPALLVYFACCIGATAQTGPLCSLLLSPTTGTAALLVTATGGCADAASSIATETLDWGDGTQTPVPASSFATFSLQHTYTAGGTFNVVLAASDAANSQTSVTQQVVVNPNAPPTCDLSVSPASGTAPLKVTASGNCSDPENDIKSTTITWGDGTSTSGTSGAHSYKTAGTFTAELTATDTSGNTGSASQDVTVQAPNQPPTCTLQVNPDSGSAPLNVTASGNCTDPQGQSLTTVLNWGDGTTTSGASGPHTFSSPGHFTVVLTATDTGGLSGSANQKVNVTQGVTCALSVSPNSGSVPLTVTANGNCTDAQSSITSTVLNWGDGITQNSASGTHTYSVAGNYTVTLIATASGGASGTATQTVIAGKVSNTPPQCSVNVSPTSGQVPLQIAVAPNCSSPQNNISNIVVDFGDGFYSSATVGSTLNHTFAWAGSFPVTVTATDSSGNVSKPSSQTVSTSDKPTMFVGISNGQLKQFDTNSNLLKTLNSGQGGTITGMAFDALDSLYTTDFTANAVTKFDGNGNVVGNFGSGYNCQPESIVFDNSGNAYVGETGCSHALLKFDAYGNLAAAYNVTTEVEGSDWIDLAADQCTLYYTSQGTTVFRYNVCSSQQQPPFANGLSTGLGLKILPDGSVIAANKQDIVHFDSAGRVISKYTVPGEACWVSLTLDPDGKSFWAADYCSSDVMHFDINSGSQLAKFNSGAPANTVFGIGMRGPAAHLTPAGPLIASPQNISVAPGQSASLSLVFTPSGSAAGQAFTFSCANLPIGASCQFSPPMASVSSSETTVQVTISTTATSAAKSQRLGLRFFAFWFLLPAVILTENSRRGSLRRAPWKWITLALVTTALACLLACSGATKSAGGNAGSGNNGMPTPGSTTPANTYAITVRATANNFQSATVVNLTVQ